MASFLFYFSLVLFFCYKLTWIISIKEFSNIAYFYTGTIFQRIFIEKYL